MDYVPFNKWNLSHWFEKYNKNDIYQRLLIPYHIILGLYYGYRFSDIFEFCLCCWLGQNYPFTKRRPDLRNE